MKKAQSIKVLLFLFIAQVSFAQLANFSFSIVKTDETCTGNGSLTFSTSGTTAGSSLFYSVYLLPDTTTPISVVNTPTITGLSSGTYSVIALQTLGNLSNSQQEEVAILDQRTPLAYQATAQPLNCTTGNITIDVTRGTASTYEIISPIVVPPQASNVFTNLPLGEYTVKVTDVCGDALVQACTIVYVFNPQNLVLPSLAVQECELVDCDTAAISYYIHAAQDAFIAYPFTFEMTLFPPDGGIPLVYTQTVLTGDPGFCVSVFHIPFYDNPNFLTSIRIVDPCGNEVVHGGTTVRRLPYFNLYPQPADVCPKELNISICNVLFPVTVAFLEYPAGFDPALFNSNTLGPFNSGVISYVTTDQNELPDGHYVVKVTDSCGTSFQDSIEVKYSITKVAVDFDNMFYVGCVANFPVNIPTFQVPPVTVIITSAPAGFNFPIPYDYSYAIEDGLFYEPFSVPGNYTFSGINICGLPYEVTITIPVLEFVPEIYTFNDIGCDKTGSIRIRNPLAPPTMSVIITQAPPNFEFPLPFNASNMISSGKGTNDIRLGLFWPGDYTVMVYDVCGGVYGPYPINIPLNPYLDPPKISVLEGCELGFGSVKLSLPTYSIYLETVIITGAPPSYNQSIPYDVSFNISPFGGFFMNSFPEGTYTFYTKDTCGTEHTFEVTIGNHFFNTTATFQGNCGSFNLFLQNNEIDQGNISFLLQKYNPVTNQWGHPFTGAPYQAGSVPNGQNSYLLSSANYNIVALGIFRIIKAYAIYSNGNPNLIACVRVLKEFEFKGTLGISNAYKISCSNGNSQVLIVAGDTSPLTYQIIAKNGQPYFVDILDSNIFTNLTPAIYKFQVKDLCGNIVTRLFDLNALSDPIVTSSSLCDGQVGQLNVQPFSFLSYQWWKAGDPTTILSTTSTLNFAPFSIATSPGTYFVRVYSETVLSCVDIIISYVIPNANDPKAGDDHAVSICSLNSINLNTLLKGVYDSYGVWTEISTSGMLTGSSWLPVGLAQGIYTFNYRVNGFCGVYDEAIITITLNDQLANPTVHFSPNYCLGDSIQFDVDNIPNAVFEWVGPNNYTSTNQNLSIQNSTFSNAGTYTVKATSNGCVSSSDVSISIHPIPEFTLETNCIDSNNILSLVPFPNSFDSNAASYYWEGPENYTSTNSSLILNNLNPGIYSVTVLDHGCSSTKSITIRNTRCAIPNGISPNGDQKNETFDLAGFGSEIKFEIFNRYGTMVFKQDNYTNQWHGQDFNDHELPDATYYYYIKFKGGEEKTGWVYVTR